ncbi:MAG: YihY/virulence factor BrkB family protein [Flavobacteriales bacterium]|nr:YihY/virulence factor BrkB family protein [Flavobacteriales bacterium]
MLERIKRKVLFSRGFRNLIAWSRAIVLPGFAGFDIYAISRFYFKALLEGHILTRASAIAFQVFAAFFPAVIVLLTLIPYIPIPDLQNDLLLSFREMLPVEVYSFMEGTLEDLVVRKHGTLLSVSFLVGVFLASNSVNAILLGFSGSSNLTTWHSPVKQRLLSLGLLFSLSILLVVAIPLMTVSSSILDALKAHDLIQDGLESFGLVAAQWIISVFMILLSISLLYHAGDPSATRFRLFTPGALLTVLLIVLLSQVLAFVFSNFTNYNALYGSIGAILAVQVWIYMNMIAVLLGYELNISVSRARYDRHLHLRTERSSGRN